MKKRTILILISIGLLVLAGAGIYTYTQGVRIVKNEVEREQARIAALNNGSVLEWRDYRVEGLNVVFDDFHYLDTKEQIEVVAKTLRTTTRVGKTYNLDLENAQVNLGKYDQFTMDKAVLKGFNNPRSYRDFVLEDAEFDNLTWRDQSGSNASVTIARTDIEDLGNLQFSVADFQDIKANFPSSQTAVEANRLLLNNLRLVEGQNGRVNGFLYENFSIPEITTYWNATPVAKGTIQSSGNFETGTNLLQSGSFLGDFEFSVAQGDLAAYLEQSNLDDKNERFIRGLSESGINGTMTISANLDEGGRAKMSWQMDFENLAELEILALFNGYRARVLRDFSSNPDFVLQSDGANLPESFSDLVLVEARINYADGELADIYLDNFANIDPALASFFAQMTLPRYLPNDRELVRETATALSNFLRDRNDFSIEAAPEAPVGFRDLVLIFQNQGPYKDALGVSIQGQ